MKKFFLTALALSAFLSLVPYRLQAELVFGPDQESHGNQLDVIVAVVNEDVITRSELDKALAMVEHRLQSKGTSLPAQDVLENQVLERLILAKLEQRAAERNGIVVDDQTVNTAIETIARQNNLTLSQLRETIERDGFDFASFREQIRQEIMVTRLRQRVVDSQIQIADQEVENLLGTAPATGDNEYHLAQILIALPEGASPEQIEAGRQKALNVLKDLHQGTDFKREAMSVSDDRQALEGGDLGWRKVDQLPTLFVEVVPRMQPGEISDLIRSPSGFHIVKLLEVRGTDKTIISQTHVRHILIATGERTPDAQAQQQLQRLYERIENGADFAELARANSNDTVSAVRGGDLGWISPGDLPPAFQQEIDKLQPGELSRPFRSPLGWHVVQVIERRQRDSSDQSQRARAREALFKRRSEEEWDMWLRRLRDEAYVENRLHHASSQEPQKSSNST